MTRKSDISKRNYQRWPRLKEAASALGVSYGHARLVMNGERSSRSFMDRYNTWMNTAPKAGMKATPQIKAPTPAVDLAAMENFTPQLFGVLAKLNIELVLVFLRAGKGSPVWRFPKIAEQLGEELQSANAGIFDSDLFVPDARWIIFHSNDLAKAMTTLKDSLEARGLLPISAIFNVESPEKIQTWFPETAEPFNFKEIAE